MRRARRRARRQAVRRPAPADRDRARDAQGRADPAARRSHQRARFGGRGRDPAEPGRADAGQDRHRDRPPAVDDRGDGPAGRDRRRPDRRERRSRDTARRTTASTRGCGRARAADSSASRPERRSAIPSGAPSRRSSQRLASIPPAKPVSCAGRADDAVAGGDDRDRVAAVGRADGADRVLMADLACERAIAAGLAERDRQQRLPDFALERRAAERQRQVEARDAGRRSIRRTGARSRAAPGVRRPGPSAGIDPPGPIGDPQSTRDQRRPADVRRASASPTGDVRRSRGRDAVSVTTASSC